MSKQPMDLLPLIPGKDGSQNAARPLRESLQDTLDGELYSKKVAEYIIHSQIDEELKIKENAEQVIQIYEGLNEVMESVDCAGKQIMEQQGQYFIKRDQLNNNTGLKERTRLQHCSLFKNLKMFYVDYFGFLQKKDLMPDAIKNHMDFKFNMNLHLCQECFNKLNRVERISFRTEKCNHVQKESTKLTDKKKRSCKDHNSQHRAGILKCKDLKCFPFHLVQKVPKMAGEAPFSIMPKVLEFYNCEIGKTYKRTAKLTNTGSFTQSLVIKDFPKFSSFSVDMDLNSKLASGLNCHVTVIYKPEVHRDIKDVVTFRNQLGFIKSLPITVSRESPRLIVCIFKSNTYHINRPKPGSARFSELRREALNSSIDCGSCLVGEHLYLSIFVQNKGMKGRFFIITEDEWYFENVETISKSMEYSSDTLWIYPTFFELEKEDTTQLNILFFPSKPEMYLEKFYLMCDNNSYEQLEVIGDGLMFSKKLLKIDVPPNDIEIEKKENYCIFLGTLESDTSYHLTLTIHNMSSLVLRSYWKFRNKHVRDICDLDESWIELEKGPKLLAPYSTIDFKFKINLKTRTEGVYSIYFNLFIADVPIMSLEKDVKFLLIHRKKSKKMLTKCVDVHFTEFEVACKVENPEQLEEEDSTTSTSESLSSSNDMQPINNIPKVQFSSPVLDFGILPSGLSVQRPFWVQNMSLTHIKWKIVEIKYNIDVPPYMEFIGTKNLSCDSGEFFCACQEQSVYYNIINMGPTRWASMLLLLSVGKNEKKYEIESLCIVTYEIINYNMTINGHLEDPMLCPMKLLYIRVPHTLSFTIKNLSPITGAFYFLKAFGKSSEFVKTDIFPKCGVLKPLQSKSIGIVITSTDVGIFEDVYIPCFIGKDQECIILRVLCAVDTIHLAMYLPGVNNYYQKVTWPPKIVYEYDDNWMICPCTLEYAPSFELGELTPSTGQDRSKGTSSPSKSEFKPGDNTPDPSSSEEVITERSLVGSEGEEEVSEIILSGSVSKTISVSNTRSSTSDVGTLKKILQDQFGNDLFLQDHIVEILDVQLRTPKKITFYLENVTPVESSYAVEATNFSTSKTFNKMAYKIKLKKTEDIFNDMIANEYGIVVIPDVKEPELPGFGITEVNITIFANTWGIYQEEIAVDVADTPCFTFSLLIEVVGCPVMLPMALNSITAFPTIRFGTVPYYSKNIERTIRVSNTSIVPVKLLWHCFLRTSLDKEDQLKFNAIFDITSLNYLSHGAKFDTTLTYYGTELSSLFTVTPREALLKENSSDFITISMTPDTIPSQPENTYVTCSIIGRIYVEEHHRFHMQNITIYISPLTGTPFRKKPNYFFRPTSLENLNVRVEAISTFELPALRPDFICGESSLRFYANEVIFDSDFQGTMRLIFQNSYQCAVDAEMSVEDPFEMLTSKSRTTRRILHVKPLCCLEITIACNIDHERLLKFSEVVYPKKGEDTTELKSELNVQSVNSNNKILHIRRYLKIFQKGRPEQAYPLHLNIHFPHISAKPTVLKLDQTLVGNTYKVLVTVFNHTGYLINFEILKSLSSEILFVTPHYGHIEKSTGPNMSFVNIFIYFTPRETGPYMESVRIVTNIPNYFIEIPIKATGTLNEKFHKDYKI